MSSTCFSVPSVVYGILQLRAIEFYDATLQYKIHVKTSYQIHKVTLSLLSSGLFTWNMCTPHRTGEEKHNIVDVLPYLPSTNQIAHVSILANDGASASARSANRCLPRPLMQLRCNSEHTSTEQHVVCTSTLTESNSSLQNNETMPNTVLTPSLVKCVYFHSPIMLSWINS